MHPLHAATFHIPDMAAGLRFYRDVLGYRIQSESTVSAALAVSWHAEKLAGAISVLMAPEAGSAGGHIRLIESPDAISCIPFQHYGWCGVEFAVQDNLTLAQHLKEAGCDILMEPMPPYRPMAAAGLFGEGLLFNEPQEKNPFHYTVIDTKSPVDQIAIAVLACRDRTISEDFYGQLLGAKPGHRAEMPLPFANKAMGLSEETVYQTGAMRVGRTPFIEIDQYPQASDQSTPPGLLPPGLALATFRIPSFDHLSTDLVSDPLNDSDPFYGGQRSATCLGPDGERIELIEWAD